MHICFTISSLHCGGSERVVCSLANNFIVSGNDVSIVLVSTSDKSSFYELNKNIRVYPLLKKEKRTNRFFRVIKLRRLLRSLHPDIVISFLPHITIYTYYALKGLRTPLICSERNDPHQYSAKTIRRLKKIFTNSNGCVFQTKDAREFYGCVSEDKSKIIVNPVTLTTHNDYKKDSPNTFEFLSVGRLEEQKRFDLLIESFCEFHETNNNYFLKIYGSGTLKNELNKLIDYLGASQYIKISEPNKYWHDEAKNVTAFVSTSDFEGMPNALEEALCLGCQCIATDCPIGGSKYLFDLFNAGCLVKTNDKISLVESFLKAIKNEIPRNIYGTKKVSPEVISEQWISFIYNILKRKMNK